MPNVTAGGADGRGRTRKPTDGVSEQVLAQREYYREYAAARRRGEKYSRPRKPANDCGPTEVRACNRCGLSGPAAETFYRDPRAGGGYSSQCRACRRSQNEASRQRRMARPASEIPVPDAKTCRGCEAIKPASEYDVSRSNLDGLNSRCKECRAPQKAAWQRDNWDHCYRKMMSWIQDNPERHRMLARTSASRRRAGGRPPHPILIYAKTLGECHICNLPVSPDEFHVDHVQPVAKGGDNQMVNLMPAHPTCNQKKSARHVDDLSPEFLESCIEGVI